MQKTIIYLTLSSLLTLSGCSDKKKEEKTESKQKIHNKDISEKEPNSIKESNTSRPTTQILKPFKPTLEANISQEEIVTESLENLETDALKSIQPQITKEMQKIPDCLEKAENKEEAFACSKQLRALNKELALAMGDFSDDTPEGYDDTFIWNEETKVNMIKEIEAGTRAMQEMQACMEASRSSEELKNCLKP
jgi:hypothetical protein